MSTPASQLHHLSSRHRYGPQSGSDCPHSTGGGGVVVVSWHYGLSTPSALHGRGWGNTDAFWNLCTPRIKDTGVTRRAVEPGVLYIWIFSLHDPLLEEDGGFPVKPSRVMVESSVSKGPNLIPRAHVEKLP